MILNREQFLEVQVAFLKIQLLINQVEKSKLMVKLIIQGLGMDPNKNYTLDEEKLSIEETGEINDN